MFDLVKAIQEQEPATKKTTSGKVINLSSFLNHCCHKLNTTPEEVKTKLLHQGNIEDIISGEIPAKCIRAHIEVWVVDGKKKVN